MALQTELLSILDNSDEPLPKRLRIATHVFNSNDLPPFHKESVLFQWIGKTCLKADLSEVWGTLHECITSEQMKGISANEIKHNVLHTIVKAVTKKLKKHSVEGYKDHVTKCGIAILNNDTFQQYFKHDLELYCDLVAEILSNSDDINVVKSIINTNLQFLDKNFDKTDYMTQFSASTFDKLVEIVIKFNDDDDLYKEVQKLIRRVMFSSNSNDFTNFLTNIFEDHIDNSSNIIYEKLQMLYNYETQTAKFGFKIIFSTSLHICNSEILRYKLFILILHLIGFKVKKIFKLNLIKTDTNFDLDKSLEILSEILEIIHVKNITIKETINNISFSDFLKSLIVSIIRLQTKPNRSTLIILKYVIDIDPLIIENIISEIIALITLSKKSDEVKTVYSELMISIMKIYFKLHRVAKFYPIFLDTIQKKVCSNYKSSKPEIKFSGDTASTVGETVTLVEDVLPENVLQYFQECITLQHSKEVTSIVRTCIYNLKQVSDNLQYYTDENRVFFVQIVSEITCNVLSGVKLADNSSTEHYVNKFIGDMNFLRDELKNLGTALLTVEHNHVLMYSFLNICYTWAEVAILLAYYINTTTLNFKGEIENSTSVNDLTYLHNYLTAEQWSLVVERIKNFGEQPCKYILQKLLIQKLRAVMIFENEISGTLESSIISIYASNLETSWDIILSERFIAPTFVPKMEKAQLINLSKLLFNHVLKNNNFELIKQRTLIDSRDLMTSLFYISLSKISDLFKKKRKLGDSTKIKSICTKIFKDIDQESFIRNEIVDMEKVIENLTNDSNEIKDFKLNEDGFLSFMEMIKYIPVTFLSDDLQVTLFCYLLSICYDLRNCRTQNINCLNKCEEYLIALVENPLSSPNILNFVQSDILIKYIVESIEKYKLLLSIIIGKGLTQNTTIPSFKPALNFLEKNSSDDKYLEIIFLVFQVVDNAALKNVTEENKKVLEKYKEKLYNRLFKYLVKDESIIDNKVRAYTGLLKHYLSISEQDMLAKLTPLLKQYIDFAVDNINENNAEEFLSLFHLLLSEKSNFEDISEDFNMVSWNACKILTNTDKLKHFDDIITLIFKNSSLEDFSNILQQLLDNSLVHLKSNDASEIINQLRIWKILVHSDLQQSKNDIVSNMSQILLSNLALFLTNNSSDQEFTGEFIKFQTRLIENRQFILSPTIIDVHFQTVHILISKENSVEEFISAFETSFQIFESLTQCRKELLMDRLPTFLLHFRLYLHHLCVRSNSDLNLNSADFRKVTECAFRVEKLVRSICALKKHIARIVPYLIADFLKEYEKIPLFPDVKFHLNNCLMELVELCDSHAVQFLLRVLSPASTELFKELHENYKKYYKFTGKV